MPLRSEPWRTGCSTRKGIRLEDGLGLCVSAKLAEHHRATQQLPEQYSRGILHCHTHLSRSVVCPPLYWGVAAEKMNLKPEQRPEQGGKGGFSLGVAPWMSYFVPGDH